MAVYRFWLQSSLSVIVALAIIQTAVAQPRWADTSPVPTAASKPVATCKVYSLSDLGDDPKLCKWIAETIPEMIQPASWKQGDAKISFYAPSRLLVISNTPAVHAQVDEFLQNMKKSVAQSRPTPGLLPAQFAVPDSVRPAQGVQSGPGGYPVPITPQAPKHLFHFIIRYEGEGIIDSNVVGFAKALKEAAENGASSLLPTSRVEMLPTQPSTFSIAPMQPSDSPPVAAPARKNAPMMPPADPAPVRATDAEPAPTLPSNTPPVLPRVVFPDSSSR